MSLIVKAKGNKKIFISGLDIELPQVYVRIRFSGDYDGKTIDAETATFANNQSFLEGKVLYTDVPIGNFKATLLPNETQSLETVHEYAKKTYEEMGYEVEISL